MICLPLALFVAGVDVLQERADSGSVESSLYEGLIDLFPESYCSAGLDIADSGKLQVLSDLLAAIRQFGPSDRCVAVSCCVCSEATLFGCQ